MAGGPCGWLVVWDTIGDVAQAARISPSGEVLDVPPIELEVGPSPFVIFDGTHWVVYGWKGNFSGGGTTRIMRLSVTGELVDQLTIPEFAAIGVDNLGYVLSGHRPQADSSSATSTSPVRRWKAHRPLSSHLRCSRTTAIVWSTKTARAGCSGSATSFASRQSERAGRLQNLGSSTYADFTRMGDLALAAWQAEPGVKVGLAPSDGALEVKEEIAIDADRFMILDLAPRNDTEALLVTSVYEGTPVPSSRIYAQVLEITGSTSSGPDVDEGECVFDPETGGEEGGSGGESGAGHGGAAGEGTSAGGENDGAATDGGVPENSAGAPGDQAGRQPSR